MNWILDGVTLENQHYGQKDLVSLCERVRRKRSLLWENDFLLHQDNVPAHTALLVKQFFGLVTHHSN